MTLGHSLPRKLFGEHYDEFNLINMNGRCYDPLLGRFLSPDNYVQMPDFTQNFNRYTYCLNNPTKYTDPSGELTWFDVAAGALIVAGTITFVIAPNPYSAAAIGSGFAHFANTINGVEDEGMTWNEASNYAGIQATIPPIDINWPESNNHDKVDYDPGAISHSKRSSSSAGYQQPRNGSVLEYNINYPNSETLEAMHSTVDFVYMNPTYEAGGVYVDKGYYGFPVTIEGTNAMFSHPGAYLPAETNFEKVNQAYGSENIKINWHVHNLEGFVDNGEYVNFRTTDYRGFTTLSKLDYVVSRIDYNLYGTSSYVFIPAKNKVHLITYDTKFDIPVIIKSFPINQFLSGNF